MPTRTHSGPRRVPVFRHISLTVLLLALSGCDVSAPGGPARASDPERLLQSVPEPQWLKVGTRVPVGVSIPAPPEPFSPVKHGAALQSDVAFPNLARAPENANAPKRGRGQANRPLPAPPPGTGDRGFWLHQTTAPWFGAYAVYDLNMSLGLPAASNPNGVWVYAPTMMPPGGSCVEVTQVYRRINGGATTGKLFGVYDWCQSSTGEFDVLEAQVTAWTNRYVRTYQGKPTYAVTIVTPNTGHTMGQCWYAHLYDYLLGGWVQRLARCGTPARQGSALGWTMWESWWLTNTSTCPSLPSIRSLDITLYHPTTGAAVPFKNAPYDYSQLGPTGTCWQNGVYSFASPVPGLPANSWRGNTPNSW